MWCYHYHRLIAQDDRIFRKCCASHRFITGKRVRLVRVHDDLVVVDFVDFILHRNRLCVRKVLECGWQVVLVCGDDGVYGRLRDLSLVCAVLCLPA